MARQASRDLTAMLTLKLTLAYDGTHYAGWQRQKRASKPTIQGVLEAVLRRILQERVRVIGSGRTDAGVHAEAQVAHARTRRAIEPARLARSLNQLLPPDIAVSRLDIVNGFHARFDARRKRYRYRMVTRSVVSPFIRRYVHQVQYRLDANLMRREATALVGRHDFRAFARGPVRGSARRLLSDARVVRRGGELHIELEGPGFLHTMVRSIVGTLLDVGRGHRPPGTVRRMLRTHDRRLAGPTAPAKGLTLVSVTYAGGRGPRSRIARAPRRGALRSADVGARPSPSNRGTRCPRQHPNVHSTSAPCHP